MGNQAYAKPRGTVDLLGDEAKRYLQLTQVFSVLAEEYGARLILTPTFEETPLFIRGVGDSSDIVRKQTFDLVNKGSSKDYTLRPEFTAGVVRSFIENKIYASPDTPQRFYYYGSVFRYERPGAGRLREFRQFGVEFFDKRLDFNSQAEAIILAYRGARRVLNRELRVTLNYLGGNLARASYRKALTDYFKNFIENMCEDCKERFRLNPLRILDCKVEKDQQVVKGAPRIEDYLSHEDKEEFASILKVLKDLKIPFVISGRMVRGLDYYTGTVFEIEDASHPELGALGGGGKYSSLVSALGGPEIEGIGFSYGLDRLLEASKESFKAEEKNPSFFVLPMGKEKGCQEKASLVAELLREKGYAAVMPSLDKSVGGAFKMADRIKAKKVLLVNSDLTLEEKDMEKREQRKVTLEDLLK